MAYDDDKALWERFKRISPPPLTGRVGEGGERIGDLDPLKLAAWIDGRLDGAEAAAMEAQLAGDPHALDLVLAAEQARGLAAPWPKRAQARAAGIITPGRISVRVFAAAIAAVLLLAIGGFEMGSLGSESTASANGETDLAVELGLMPGADIVEVSL
jgi:hypothetical protein